MYVCLHACDLRKFCSLGFLAIAAVHAAVYSDATHIEEHLPLQATHAPDTDKRHVAPAPTMSAGICAFGLHCLPRASGPRGILPPGTIFVPIRYPSPHPPEVGLPARSPGCWFGETNVQTGRGVREMVLAAACNWSTVRLR